MYELYGFEKAFVDCWRLARWVTGIIVAEARLRLRNARFAEGTMEKSLSCHLTRWYMHVLLDRHHSEYTCPPCYSLHSHNIYVQLHEADRDRLEAHLPCII